MATPLQKQLSPSEQRFFADILNNAGQWSDAEDLADAGLSLSDDGRTLYIADEDEAFKYIDNFYRTEFRPTHNYRQTLRPDKGLAPVPKSFNDPDAFLRSSGPGNSRIGARLGPQDEFNLMYGGDEGFAVEEGFEDLMRGFEPESELDFEARRRLSQRQAKGIRDVDEAARRTVQREKADRVAQAADSRREERFMRALQQSEDRNELMVLMNEDRVVDEKTKRRLATLDSQIQRFETGQYSGDPTADGLRKELQLQRDALIVRDDLPPPRAIEEIVEDPRYFERFNEDPRYSLNRSGVISQRLAEIDEQISALSTHPDLDNALPEDPEAGKLTRKLDELSKERDYLRSWKQQTDQSSLARGMAPEAPRGEPRGSWTPDAGELPRPTGMARRPSSGGTEAAQGVMRGGAAMEPQSTRVLTDRALTNLGPAELEQQLRTPQARTQLKQKNTVNAQRLLQLLKDPDIKTKVTPGQHGKLRVAAAKLAPVLEALGNAALAAELAYFVGRERDLGKGLMAMGASNVEGTGALMQLPQAGVEAARSAFVPEELQDLPLPGEIATRGLAAAGRGLQGTVGAYNREQKRKEDREFIARNAAFYMDMNPAITEAEARSSAAKMLRGIEDAPPGGYPQRAPEPVVQRSLGEEQEQMYNDYLLQEGYLKRGTGRHEGALLQGPRTRKEGGYPTMSDFKDQQALSDGFPAQSGMISRNIREYGTQNPSPEIDGGGRIMGPGEAAKYVNRVVDARTREDHRAYVKRARDFYRELEPTLSEDQVREMAKSAQEDFDRAYQGSESERQKVNEARYRRAYLPGTRR